MNPRARWPAVIVAACAIGVIAVLAWVTAHALRLERREQEARADAVFQESVRLALWRMDSTLAPILTREAVRPYFHYQPFYAADRAYTSMWEEVKPGEVLVPSPLLQEDASFVRLHYQKAADGVITSPQVPTGNMRDLAESVYVPSERVIAGEAMLTRVETMLARSTRKTAPAPGAASAAARRGAGESPSFDGATGAGRPAVTSAGGVVDQLEADVSRPIDEASKPAVEPQKPEAAVGVLSEKSSTDYEARRQAVENAQVRAEQSAPLPSVRTPPRRDADEGAEGKPLEAAESGDRSAESSAWDDAAADAPAPSTGRDVVRNKADAKLRKSAESAGRRSEDKAGEYRSGLEKEQKKESKDAAGPRSPEVRVGDVRPAWRLGDSGAGPELFLVRTVRLGDATVEQGCWLDWPGLRGRLLAIVRDLLPGASLSPITSGGAPTAHALSRRLAAIPVDLDPGASASAAPGGWTPMRTALTITWVIVLAAIAGLAALVRASEALAERRGRFVSAVTHELRTPLTTFVMYSQMLADGMVAEEPARREYLGTLKRESQRLARIVENVLDYARLGRARAPVGAERVPAGEILAKIVPDLRQRCEQGGLTLEVRDSTGPNDTLRVDELTVERVLFNLVDNACKYGADGVDRSVALDVSRDGGDVVFRVEDRGRGLSDADRRRIFRPFERGSRLEHAATPGLGLGLALSLELARRSGGGLTLERTGPEVTAFALRLPIRSA